MQLLFDLFPIAIFFTAYAMFGIYIATASAMVASVFQIGYMWYRYRKVDKAPLVTVLTILLFGGATLFFHNDWFIKVKATVLYWILVLLVVRVKVLQRAPLSKQLLAEKVHLSQRHWLFIDNLSAIFFAGLGLLNIWVAYRFSTTIWVYFKLFGAVGLTLLFFLGVSLYITKHADTIEFNKNA